MKSRCILTVVVISLITISASAYDEIRRDCSVKDKNLFVFKTDKTLLGAVVEIYSSNGEFLASQSLQKRKVVIDFGEVRFGTYTIRIAKGSRVHEFKYVKY